MLAPPALHAGPSRPTRGNLRFCPEARVGEATVTLTLKVSPRVDVARRLHEASPEFRRTLLGSGMSRFSNKDFCLLRKSHQRRNSHY